MIKIKQSDIEKLNIKIEDISCHISPEAIEKNKYICIRSMLEEIERLKKYLINLDKTGKI